jgi:hypothetical protein
LRPIALLFLLRAGQLPAISQPFAFAAHQQA